MSLFKVELYILVLYGVFYKCVCFVAKYIWYSKKQCFICFSYCLYIFVAYYMCVFFNPFVQTLPSSFLTGVILYQKSWEFIQKKSLYSNCDFVNKKHYLFSIFCRKLVLLFIPIYSQSPLVPYCRHVWFAQPETF